MTLCKNEEMNKGGPYPRSCPTCGFSRVCKRNIPLDLNIHQQKYGHLTTEQEASETKYAVLITETISHPGDQRSRDCPGHGYPAYDEQIEKIQTFNDLDGLKSWIKSASQYQKYTAIKYEKLKVSTEIQVSVQ